MLLLGDFKPTKITSPAPEILTRTRGLSEQRDNPSKGIAFYLLHTVLMSVNLYVNKASF
jgi:hypothetical protein